MPQGQGKCRTLNNERMELGWGTTLDKHYSHWLT